MINRIINKMSDSLNETLGLNAPNNKEDGNSGKDNLLLPYNIKNKKGDGEVGEDAVGKGEDDTVGKDIVGKGEDDSVGKDEDDTVGKDEDDDDGVGEDDDDGVGEDEDDEDEDDDGVGEDEDDDGVGEDEDDVNDIITGIVENDYKYDSDSDEETDSDSDGDDLSENYDNDDSDEEYEKKFKKIDKLYEKNVNKHSEIIKLNNSKLNLLSRCIKNKNKIPIDPFHATIPILTKYERAKILGIRCEQLSSGCKPLINSQYYKRYDSNILIAKKELQRKKLPFIIKRPLPNGESEYWKLEDLEIIDF